MIDSNLQGLEYVTGRRLFCYQYPAGAWCSRMEGGRGYLVTLHCSRHNVLCSNSL